MCNVVILREPLDGKTDSKTVKKKNNIFIVLNRFLQEWVDVSIVLKNFPTGIILNFNCVGYVKDQQFYAYIKKRQTSFSDEVLLKTYKNAIFRVRKWQFKYKIFVVTKQI